MPTRGRAHRGVREVTSPVPFPLLSESLRAAPVIRIRDYDYFVHPITDGIPQVDPGLLEEVVRGFRDRLPASFEKILTAEAMGIPLAAALSLATGHAYTVARKRSYGLPGETAVAQRTGYAEGRLHVHGLRPGERVLLVDDVVSTGGTLRALVQACGRAGSRPVKVLVAVNKTVDLEALGREFGCPVESLVRVRVEGGKVLVEA